MLQMRLSWVAGEEEEELECVENEVRKKIKGEITDTQTDRKDKR
jgi:hypothetical protein